MAKWEAADLRQALEDAPKQKVKLRVQTAQGETWNRYTRRREVMAAVTALAYCAKETRMAIKVKGRIGKCECKRVRIKVKVH